MVVHRLMLHRVRFSAGALCALGPASDRRRLLQPSFLPANPQEFRLLLLTLAINHNHKFVYSFGSQRQGESNVSGPGYFWRLLDRRAGPSDGPRAPSLSLTRQTQGHQNELAILACIIPSNGRRRPIQTHCAKFPGLDALRRKRHSLCKLFVVLQP